MSTNSHSRLIPWLLLAGGSCLLFLGARDWVRSHIGQSDAEREFEQTLPPPSRSPRKPPNQIAADVRNGAAFARMTIPRLNTQLYVLEGVGNRELSRGPGHMPGSALPGEIGNCIIAGHRDTHFRVLKDIRKGDDILLDTPRGTYLYRVREASIVSPDDRAPLRETADGRLNLITCYPFFYVGNAPKRFIVEAELAGLSPRARPQS
jgi:sortase A